MRMMMKKLILGMMVWSALSLLGFCEEEIEPEVLPERVSEFVVKTRSELNKALPFYIRTPLGFRPGDKKPRRLLFLCPFLNESGIKALNRSAGLLNLADERGWFVMSCSFKQGLGDVRDRKKSYYYPEGFSGKAVLEALDHVAKTVPIDTERLLMHGLSGGGQFVHRFAMWAPERVSAVSVNSSSWFDTPGEGCEQVAWMVIIGESDHAFDASLRVTEELRSIGAAPLFRSYIGMGHEGGGNSVQDLVLAWLKFQDERTGKFLGKKKSRLDPLAEKLAMKAEEMPYVGDGQIWTYKENTPENVADLPEDGAVFLPSKAIAELWGTYEGAGQ